MIPELSLWNPLDWLRLLWWLLVTPERYQAYRVQMGTNSTRRMVSLLVATLIWWPLFVPVLSVNLGLIRRSSVTMFNGYSTWAVVLLAAYLLTVGLGLHEDEMPVGVMNCAILNMMTLISFVAVYPALVAPDDVPHALAIGSLAGGAMGVALSLGVGRMFAMPFDSRDAARAGWPGLVVLLGMFLCVPIMIGPLSPLPTRNMASAFLTMMIASFGMIIVIRLVQRKSKDTSSVSRRVVGAIAWLSLVFAHGILIWIYLLDGWRLLGSV